MLNINKKLISALALVVAVVMVASPLAFMGGSDNADAPALGAASTSTTTGTYTIFVDDGSGWQSQVVNAYDGAQAVQATSFWTGNPGVMADRTITEYGYVNLNASYGDITTFMGKTEDANNVWNVYVLIGSNWVLGQDAIGYYKCFSDYDATLKTANIALEYGADATTVPSLLETFSVGKISSIANVTETSAFEVTFNFKNILYDADTDEYVPVINGTIKDVNNNNVTADSLAAGVTVKGYGSDAYLALKNALNVVSASPNVVASESIPSNYSWITTIFGMGTVQTGGMDTPSDWTDDTYAYWILYEGDYLENPELSVADFVSGAYSPVGQAPDLVSEFSFIYNTYIM